jgi:hypothetical protein
MFAIASVAGALLMGGCASASTQSPPAGGTAAPNASPTDGTSAATTATAGVVHLTDYTDNDGPTSTVILAGAIGDYGKAENVNPNGTINPEHNSQLNLKLTQGSFRLSIADLAKKFVSSLGQFAPNTVTCSGTVTVTGVTPIVAGSGTGSYTGISGNFNLTITLDEVFSKSNCTESGAFLGQAIVITGSGTVSVS